MNLCVDKIYFITMAIIGKKSYLYVATIVVIIYKI